MIARRIVLTRHEEANRLWAERLRQAGHAVLELPLLRFEPLAAPAGPVTGDWILFTSPQGVRAFVAAGLAAGTARMACLGTGTAAALAEVGLTDALGLETRDGAELAAAFTGRVNTPARVVLPGPDRRLTEPRATLEAAGFTVHELPLYKTVAALPEDLPSAPFAAGDMVFFCSPSAVRAFTGAWRHRPDCVSIGETTAPLLREAGFAPLVSDEPNLQSMVRAAGLDPIPAPAPESGS